MNVSYKKLWKKLIDKDMNKTDLRLAIGASTATMAKLSKGESVSMDVLLRICQHLDCDIGDIMVMKSRKNAGANNQNETEKKGAS